MIKMKALFHLPVNDTFWVGVTDNNEELTIEYSPKKVTIWVSGQVVFTLPLSGERPRTLEPYQLHGLLYKYLNWHSSVKFPNRGAFTPVMNFDEALDSQARLSIRGFINDCEKQEYQSKVGHGHAKADSRPKRIRVRRG